MATRRGTGPQGARGRRRLGWVLAAALAGGGCADADAVESRLTDAAPSLEALGREIWEAVVQGDTATLRRLRLSEHEHNTLVWPEQPAAREPSAAANLDLWWRNIEVRNRAALDDLLRAFSGSDLAFRSVECRGEPRGYETFRALTDCFVTVDGSGGPERVQAFRYAVEMDGGYKVVRYYGRE